MSHNRVYTTSLNSDDQSVFTFFKGWKAHTGYKSFSTLEEALTFHRTAEPLMRIDKIETTVVWKNEDVS